LRTFREHGSDTTVIVSYSTIRTRPDLHCAPGNLPNGRWLTFRQFALNLSRIVPPGKLYDKREGSKWLAKDFTNFTLHVTMRVDG